MTQLSKDIKTHALTTIKGNTYFINERQYRTAMSAEMSDRLNFGEVMLVTHQIAEITAIDKWYENNPEKKPTFQDTTVMNGLPDKKTWDGSQRKKIVSKMADEFERYWHGREMPEHAKKLLFNMRNRAEYAGVS